MKHLPPDSSMRRVAQVSASCSAKSSAQNRSGHESTTQNRANALNDNSNEENKRYG